MSSSNSNSLRVLIIADTHGQIGGAEVVLDQLINRLKIRKHNVNYMTLHDLPSFKVPFWPGLRAAIPWGIKAKIAERIATYKPDIIFIAFLGLLSYAAGQYCYAHGIPFNIFYPSRIPEISKKHLFIPERISYYFVKNLLSKAEKIFVPTTSVKNDLQVQGLQNIMVWHHGVEDTLFTLPTQKEKQQATITCKLSEKTRPFYLYVGRLSKGKNIQALLNLKLPGTKIFVGPEDYGYTIKQLQKKYPHDIFVGAQQGKDLLAYYHCSDIFMFASKTDTFGLVLLEALACGLPIVAYDVSGPCDVAPPGCGVSYLATSNDELQTYAINAWNDLQTNRITPAQCRAHAQKFSWDMAVDFFLEKAQRTR